MAVQDVQHTLSRTPAEAGSGVHRVLVAFDGSPSAWTALHQAIEVAVSNRALLTIAAVVHEPSALWMGFGAMSVPYTRDTVRLALEREMRLHLAEARDEVPRHRVGDHADAARPAGARDRGARRVGPL